MVKLIPPRERGERIRYAVTRVEIDALWRRVHFRVCPGQSLPCVPVQSAPACTLEAEIALNSVDWRPGDIVVVHADENTVLGIDLVERGDPPHEKIALADA